MLCFMDQDNGGMAANKAEDPGWWAGQDRLVKTILAVLSLVLTGGGLWWKFVVDSSTDVTAEFDNVAVTVSETEGASVGVVVTNDGVTDLDDVVIDGTDFDSCTADKGEWVATPDGLLHGELEASELVRLDCTVLASSSADSAGIEVLVGGKRVQSPKVEILHSELEDDALVDSGAADAEMASDETLVTDDKPEQVVDGETEGPEGVELAVTERWAPCDGVSPAAWDHGFGLVEESSSSTPKDLVARIAAVREILEPAKCVDFAPFSSIEGTFVPALAGECAFEPVRLAEDGNHGFVVAPVYDGACKFHAFSVTEIKADQALSFDTMLSILFLAVTVDAVSASEVYHGARPSCDDNGVEWSVLTEGAKSDGRRVWRMSSCETK